jgi:hypothetical protein
MALILGTALTLSVRERRSGTQPASLFKDLQTDLGVLK